MCYLQNILKKKYLLYFRRKKSYEQFKNLGKNIFKSILWMHIQGLLL
jgi:hypothetical protein